MNRIFKKVSVVVIVLAICASLPVSRALVQEQDSFSILLIGTDRAGLTRQQINEGVLGRADAMIYTTVNLTTGDIAMLSIDRDYMIMLPAPNYETKLCTTTVIGGPELTVSEVNKVLGTSLEYYALVDYVDMRRILDEVGDITIEIMESDLSTQKYLSKHMAFNKAGVQKVNSLQAIGLMRNRDYGELGATEGDLIRNDRQRRVLIGIMEKLKSMDLSKLLKTMSRLFDYIETNIDGAALLSLVPTVISLGIAQPKQARYPQNSTRKIVNLHSVVLPDDPEWERGQAYQFLYGE